MGDFVNPTNLLMIFLGKNELFQIKKRIFSVKAKTFTAKKKTASAKMTFSEQKTYFFRQKERLKNKKRFFFRKECQKWLNKNTFDLNSKHKIAVKRYVQLEAMSLQRCIR